MSVSILILTLNEEKNLVHALRSVDWSDDICVLDSFSDDRTEEVARAGSARFFQRQFDNYSRQRNWAIENIEFKHEWIFVLDADEVVPPRLRDEIIATAVNAPDTHAAYRVRFKNLFMGHWIKHSSMYPTWVTRMLRRGRVRYETRLVNAHPICDGEVGELRHHFLHYSFNKGFSDWFAKHNRYSGMEAQESLKELREGRMAWRNLLHRDPTMRRRELKKLSIRMPGRAVAKFLYMYFVRRGILDGRAGLNYCLLQSYYEYLIALKVVELIRREKSLPL